uniref:Uncharacterized protein n=1 Tax=Cacopsylla melanoneura TaxID=428564 RepID=A0A8D8LLB9_9HEMI
MIDSQDMKSLEQGKVVPCPRWELLTKTVLNSAPYFKISTRTKISIIFFIPNQFFRLQMVNLLTRTTRHSSKVSVQEDSMKIKLIMKTSILIYRIRTIKTLILTFIRITTLDRIINSLFNLVNIPTNCPTIMSHFKPCNRRKNSMLRVWDRTRNVV